MEESTVLNIFQALELSSLAGEWVEHLHSTEFTEEPAVDLELPADVSLYMVECGVALRQYTTDLVSQTSSRQTRCSLLNELIQCGVTMKRIQSWLYYMFHKGLKVAASFEEKNLAILASDIYFLLLKLPGMSSSELHHAILFEKAVDTLLMCAQIGTARDSTAGRKRKCNPPSSQSQKRRKQSGSESTRNDDGEAHEEMEITSQQSITICKLLVTTLQDFCKYLAAVSLRTNEVSLKHVVQVMVKVANALKTNCPVSVIDYACFNNDGSSADSLSLPYQLATYALFLTVSVKHGNLDQLSLTLFRFILPSIIMRDANTPSSTVPRAFFQHAEILRRLVSHLYDVHRDSVAHSISILAQNLIAQCPDRTEFRNHIGVIVSSILCRMPLTWYAEFCDWLRRVSVHTKIVYRSNTLAVVGRLLCVEERQDDISNESQESTKHGYLLRIVIGRLMDVAPSVRSRALHVLIEIMEEGIVSHSSLQQVVNAGGNDLEVETPASSCQVTQKNTPPTLHTVPALANSCSVNNAEIATLLQLLCKCALEPKAIVRKTAVQAMEMALKYGFLVPSVESMVILEKKCRDPSLMVRKQAIICISGVLQHHKTSSHAQASWAKGVLPAILDAESSVQEKAASFTETMILNNFSDSREKEELAWSLVGFLASPKGESLRAYLQTLCRQWKRQMKLNTSLVKKIVSQLTTPSRSAGAWLFLRFITLHVSDKNIASNIANIWMVEYKKENNLMFHINSIITLGQICKKVSADIQQKVMDICIQRLKMPQCPVQLISFLVEAICNLIEALYKDKAEAWPQPLMEWCQLMLKDCDEYMYKIIMNRAGDGGKVLNEQTLVHQLYIAGNVGQHSVTKVPKRLIISLQALLTSPESLVNMAQLTASQDVPQSQPLSQFVQCGGVPQLIRAHAVINLGKICLHSSQLAKKCVPAMVRELNTCDNEMVRNNVLIVLTDLCVQQTQLVDSYISDMANCLCDESPQVRRNCLILLNSLLKKEFVKWRGSLIYKFLALLCDSNSEIQDLVRFSLINQTLTRHAGDVFFRHFVESIFYFNAYEDHNVFNKFSKSEREQRLFNFSGEEKSDDRMVIYLFMLEHMDDEHRIKLTGKLCCDILDGVADGVIPINKNSHYVLSDALAILCSQDLKLKCMKNSEEDQELEGVPNEVAANAAKNMMKQKIISQVVKRNLLENIIPIIITLKNKLVAHKSTLVRNVMLCLKEIMKDYKEEVQDILTGDKQLAREIEFDLKMFDREQEKKLHREQAVSTSNTPGPCSPMPSSPRNQSSPRQARGPVSQQRRSQNSTTPLRPPRSPAVQPHSPNLQRCYGTPTKTKENMMPPSSAYSFFSPTATARKKGIGITAMLNSARKNMHRLNIGDRTVISGNRHLERAISTPARTTALGDLTFSNVTDISAIQTPIDP